MRDPAPGERPVRLFLVCIHDATPAHARETRVMLRDLAPLLGRRLSFAVVPDWHGEWPLAAHPDYCRQLREVAEELLLHGYFHRRRNGCLPPHRQGYPPSHRRGDPPRRRRGHFDRRRRGRGPTTWLVEGADEMNGLDPHDTRRTLERGQRIFTEVFGEPARGFVAPAWQRGHVRLRGRAPSRHHVRAEDRGNGGLAPSTASGLEHLLGFFSLESRTGRKVPLATWTWDCGRWGWLGHVGHGIGRLLQSPGRRVPALAIHPRDLERGFWPGILRLIRELLEDGYEPSTAAGLLGADDLEVDDDARGDRLLKSAGLRGTYESGVGGIRRGETGPLAPTRLAGKRR